MDIKEINLNNKTRSLEFTDSINQRGLLYFNDNRFIVNKEFLFKSGILLGKNGSLGVIDASQFGFNSDVSATINTTALQEALDLTGIITIRKPGIYKLNDTITIGSNTSLICSPGVILQKTGNYSNVLINKGALTRTYDENIFIDGLTIDVNEIDNAKDMDVDGLRGHIGFFYVDNLIFRNYKCENIGSVQFGIQIVKWKNVHFDNIVLRGNKDGFDIGTGHDGIFENIIFETYDDAIAIYGVGYPSVNIEIGDIYNVTFRNFNDTEHATYGGYSCRIMPGSWADWLSGNTYKTGDICINVGNAYNCNNVVGFSGTGNVAPTHSSGTVTGADGIAWKYLNACDFYHTDIYNIVFDNCTYSCDRAAIDVRFVDDTYVRSAYPGTETLSSVYNISVINTKHVYSSPSSRLFQFFANVKNVSITNCIIDGFPYIIYSGPHNDNSNSEIDINISGCHFKGLTYYKISNIKQGQLMLIKMVGNSIAGTGLQLQKSGTATIRLINQDFPLDNTQLTTYLAPVVGDICRTDNGLWIYKSGGWVNLAV